MSTINNTDIFLISRSGANYYVTAGDVAAFAGGGGGGGVAAVTGTLPIVIAGTATNPDITINAATTTTDGTLSAADKVKIDALPATIVSSITVDGANGIFVNGSAAGVTVTTSGTATITFPIDQLTTLP